MRRMSYTARWALFFILVISFGLIAFKLFQRFPSRSAVGAQLPRPVTGNYKLNTWRSSRNGVPDIHATTKKKLRMKPTTVAVTKPPKPVVRLFKQLWKKRGTIFYRAITPITKPKLHVLLLHGAKYTSADWVKLKTMDILAAHGYKVIAMDLPGHGMSTFKFDQTKDKKRVKVMANFIRKLGISSLVIVSPSASGQYSLPYIAALKSPEVLSGYVAIAVSGTDRVQGKKFQHFPPTLILRGSKDTSLGEKSSNFLQSNVPHSTVKVIQGAGHACYMEKPKEFHEILLKFLDDILRQKGKIKA